MFGGKRHFQKRAAALLEYGIIAVGLAIFLTFGILMIAKATRGPTQPTTPVTVESNETGAASTVSTDALPAE